MKPLSQAQFLEPIPLKDGLVPANEKLDADAKKYLAKQKEAIATDINHRIHAVEESTQEQA